MKRTHYVFMTFTMILLLCSSILTKQAQAQNTDVEMFVLVQPDNVVNETIAIQPIPSKTPTQFNSNTHKKEVPVQNSTTVKDVITNNTPNDKESPNSLEYPNQSAVSPTPNETNEAMPE